MIERSCEVKSQQVANSVCSLPPVGEGWGRGWCGEMTIASRANNRATPTPHPSPQGGGERTGQAASLYVKREERCRGTPAITRVALALLTGLLAADVAHAQADARWPERPIRFIVPFTAGSSSDTSRRWWRRSSPSAWASRSSSKTASAAAAASAAARSPTRMPTATRSASRTPARTRWRRASRRCPTIRSRILPRYRCWAIRPSCLRSIPACPRKACKS